eukprot:365679-Chlamydomonas_euryale.AAC.12
MSRPSAVAGRAERGDTGSGWIAAATLAGRALPTHGLAAARCELPAELPEKAMPSSTSDACCPVTNASARSATLTPCELRIMTPRRACGNR